MSSRSRNKGIFEGAGRCLIPPSQLQLHSTVGEGKRKKKKKSDYKNELFLEK